MSAERSTLDRTGGVRRVGRYALLVVLAAIVFAPIWATLMQSLKTGPDALDHPRSLLPVDLTFSTLRKTWDLGDLGTLMRNSIVMSVLVTCGVIVTSLLSAYAFAFLRFPLRRALFAMFL